jgi:hypothetical protein
MFLVVRHIVSPRAPRWRGRNAKRSPRQPRVQNTGGAMAFLRHAP